jgi:hypothetical protein
MRIFIGYGYNERDKWVEDYVFPLIAAMDCEIVHGKAVYGGTLSEEIIKAIRASDAMIGFTTRREAADNGEFHTHEWVVQELTTAATARDPLIPWVEVREEGVRSPGGILEGAGAQRIEYKETDRAGCLVRIAQAVQRFQAQTRITTVRLGPATATDEISALLDDASFHCTCETLRGGRQLPARPIPVFPVQGALLVQLRGLARDEVVRISVFARGRAWRSSYESVDTVDIQLKE